MRISKIKNNWEEQPEKDGLFLGLNDRGFIGVVEYIRGRWFKITATMTKPADKDEKFSWIEWEK